MIFRSLALLPLGALLALTSCGAPTPPSAPPPPPMAKPAPPASADWRDWAVNPGDWRYRAIPGGSMAEYGPVGSAPLLSLRCDNAARRISFSFALTPMASDSVRIFTSFGSTVLPLQSVSFATGTPQARVEIDARNRLLDQMAFSRGRFALVITGQPPLVVPNWAEVSRVIEDCRS